MTKSASRIALEEYRKLVFANGYRADLADIDEAFLAGYRAALKDAHTRIGGLASEQMTRGEAVDYINGLADAMMVVKALDEEK